MMEKADSSKYPIITFPFTNIEAHIKKTYFADALVDLLI